MKTLVIVSVMSEFHAIGALSYVVTKKALFGEQCDFLVVVNYHHASGRFRIREGMFDFIRTTNLQIRSARNGLDKLAMVHSALKRQRYTAFFYIVPTKVSPFIVGLARFFHGIVHIRGVVIDEGLGMYLSKELWSMETKVRENQVRTIWGQEAFLRCLMSSLEKLVCSVPIHDFTLFDRRGCALALRADVAEAYATYFALDKKKQCTLELFSSDTILFVSDNLAGYIHQGDEITYYEALFSYCRKEFPGTSIVFKPHPNEMQFVEKFERLKGCVVFTHDMCVEEILNNNSISVVAGVCSSALLVSSQIFKTTTISLVGLLDPACLTEYGQRKITAFRELTADLCNLSLPTGAWHT